MESEKYNNSIVKLNVGGTTCYTHRQTLMGSLYFHHLLEGDMGNVNFVNNDEIFIDRSGSIFKTVLLYLRTCVLSFSKSLKLEDLKMEAEYYKIDGLIEEVDICMKRGGEKQVEYKLMDVTDLKSVTLKKGDGDINARVKRKSHESYEVLEVLDVMKKIPNRCFRHDKYDSSEPCNHPSVNKGNDTVTIAHHVVKETIQ